LKLFGSKYGWRETLSDNFLLAWRITIRKEPGLLISSGMLLLVLITLIIFVIQQAWFISVNKTQVELEKIDSVRTAWKEAGVKDYKYVHFYNRGLIENWKEFMFPPKPRNQTPLDYSREVAAWERAQAVERAREEEREKAEQQ
jgi:hypothetical protein